MPSAVNILQLRILKTEPYPSNTCFEHLILPNFADPSLLGTFRELSSYKGADWADKGDKSHCRWD